MADELDQDQIDDDLDHDQHQQPLVICEDEPPMQQQDLSRHPTTSSSSSGGRHMVTLSDAVEHNMHNHHNHQHNQHLNQIHHHQQSQRHLLTTTPPSHLAGDRFSDDGDHNNIGVGIGAGSGENGRHMNEHQMIKMEDQSLEITSLQQNLGARKLGNRNHSPLCTLQY